MATSLRDNLTSSYFNAAHKLYPKKARRRIIAYVESYGAHEHAEYSRIGEKSECLCGQ